MTSKQEEDASVTSSEAVSVEEDVNGALEQGYVKCYSTNKSTGFSLVYEHC